MSRTIGRQDLMAWLNDILQPEKFADYCPNGLQVEGQPDITTLVTGVTASQALLDKAVEVGADAVLVHHGWFWRGEDPTVRGVKRRRLATLLQNNLNLLAYHLPLDAHPDYGNNARLANVLGLIPDQTADGSVMTTGSKGLIWLGRASEVECLGDFSIKVQKNLGRAPTVIGDLQRPMERVAWCTGGAQGMFEDAIEAGVDAYLTGEISEQNAHLARESGVAFIAAGHHATERYGVKALGEAVAKQFGINVLFFDIDNPA